MISNDEINEKRADLESDPSEVVQGEAEGNVNEKIDSDELDNSDQLEEKKREMYNEGNTGQSQIFIQDMGTGAFTVNYYAQRMTPVVPSLPVEKRYDLRNQEECIEFVEAFKNSEYFNTTVVLCVFEAVVLTDLPDLKTKLTSCLPREIAYDAEGNVIYQSQISPYIALNSVLAVIGGKKFDTENGQKCISLGEDAIQALVNILEQFPALLDSMIDFIIQLMEEEKYCSIFYGNQIASLLVKLISVKLIDIENRVFSSLYTNAENVGVLGVFVYKLYTDNQKEKEASEIIWNWINSDREGLWKIVCFVYALFGENKITFIYEKELKEMLAKRILLLRIGDSDFIAALLVRSKAYRTMISNVLSNSYKRAETRSTAKNLAQSYVRLIRCGYYKIDCNYMELPLVACDTKEQQEYLVDILAKIMQEYRLRKQLYAILKAYLKELSRYEYNDKVMNHIAAFFHYMNQAGEEFGEDIEDLIAGCHCKAAKQIYELLF